MTSFIENFGILFLFIVGIAFIIKLLKQPIIIAYVLAGFFFSLVIAGTTVHTGLIMDLAEIGITFLLFLMGLEFDLKNFKYLGRDLIISTVLESLAFFIFAFLFASLFGFSTTEKVYLGILFMFSSTLLVAKWIDDKKENSTFHGKIILGTLIIQDIIAILAITLLALAKEPSLSSFIIIPLKGLLLIGIAFILARYVLNRMLKFSSKYPELLFILSLGVCFLFVILAPFLGYSTTIGAFIAGVTLANTIYKNDIYLRVKPLILFFNVLFFVGLGFQINIHIGLEKLIFVALLIIFSIIIKPIAIYLILKKTGYDSKTSFTSSIYLAQLSEFGIIIIAAGIEAGTLSNDISTLAILSVILTMILSSYLIRYDKFLFEKAQPLLNKIDARFKGKKKESNFEEKQTYSILFFGYYEVGKELILKLEQQGKKILVIENDPEKIALLKEDKIPYYYISINDPEFFEHFPLEKAELVISNLIDAEDNKLIIKEIKQRNPKAIAIVTAKNLHDALEFYKNKADYVIYQSYLQEKQVSVLLEEYSQDIYKVLNKKVEELTHLQEKEDKRKSIAKEQAQFLNIEQFVKRLTHPKDENSLKVKTLLKNVSSKAKSLSKKQRDYITKKIKRKSKEQPEQKI